MTPAGEEAELQTLAPSDCTERPCAAWRAKATGTGLGFPRLRPSPGARADWGRLCRDLGKTKAFSCLRPGHPPQAAHLFQKVPGGSWTLRGLQACRARVAAENGCRKAVPAAVPALSPKSVPSRAPPLRLPVPRERVAQGLLPWLGQDTRWAWVQTQSPHSWFCSTGAVYDVLGLSCLLYSICMAVQGSLGPLAEQEHGRQLDTSTFIDSKCPEVANRTVLT